MTRAPLRLSRASSPLARGYDSDVVRAFVRAFARRSRRRVARRCVTPRRRSHRLAIDPQNLSTVTDAIARSTPERRHGEVRENTSEGSRAWARPSEA